MAYRSLRAFSGTRLHLGFYNINSFDVRFGSIGLYLKHPRVITDAINDGLGKLTIPGELTDVAKKIIYETCGSKGAGISITLRESPPLHIGLGITTQALLSIAKLAQKICERESTPDRLIQITGRGEYSGVGAHAFFRGGFIVDGGRRAGEPYPPLILRYPFPKEWKIALVLPREGRGLKDAQERPILEELLKEADERVSDALLKTAFLKIVRGVISKDFGLFVSGVSELQRGVGEIFSSYQGGIFSSSATALAIESLERAGFRGTGQSSWGPLAYGFSGDVGLEDRVKALRKSLEELGPRGYTLIISEARNRGASVRPSYYQKP